jgi:hypothetical protein
LVFGFFFQKKKKKRLWGHFRNKKAKGVKLPQFESLGGGLSVTFETLEAKVKIGGYFKGVKCNFPAKYYIFDSL